MEMSLSTLLEEKILLKKRLIEQQEKEVQLLEHQLDILKNSTENISSWVGHQFESSSSLTPEFAAFSSCFHKFLNTIAGKTYTLRYSRNHFEASAFFKNIKTGRCVYVSISDVRFFPDEWYNNILVRTAKGEDDFTGGINQCLNTQTKRPRGFLSCALPFLEERIRSLTER